LQACLQKYKVSTYSNVGEDEYSFNRITSLWFIIVITRISAKFGRKIGKINF
jgi:hypothetical protein